MNRTRRIPAFLLSLGLFACSQSLSHAPNYLDDRSAFAEAGLVHVVVEIPAGTNEKWQVEKASGSLQWEHVDGKPRVVRYLAYPGNYGMIPRTSLPHEVGGDGDPLDVLLLGAQVERGSVVRARPIGMLHLVDDGERDDKILAVPLEGPLSDVTDLKSLDLKYRGVREIVETWFTNYKGPDRITSSGFGDAAEAVVVIEEASRYYEAKVRSFE